MTDATTSELAAYLHRTDLNPTMELMLSLVTCGLFGLYVLYRNQQLVDAHLAARGVGGDPKANIVGLLCLGMFVVGVSGIVALFIPQDELNKLARMGPAAPRMGPAAPMPAYG